MSSYLLFLIIGLGSGSVYALLGLGLVLEQRSSGVINFAHGAIAMFIAYVYVELRASGRLVFPWLGVPHSVGIASGGLGTAAALAIALVYAALFGLVLYLLVFRPLRTAPALGKVGASVGVMLALQAIAVLNFGTDSRSTPAIFPSGSFAIAGLRAPVDRLYLAGVAVALAVALALLYRYTHFGLATRASAENEKGAVLRGLSPSRIAAQNWMLATVLAGLAGILIVPLTTLDPSSYTLFVVPALGVALLGGFRSFALTAAGGLLLGMGQSELAKLQIVWSWLPQQGLPSGLPFVLIVVAMSVFYRGPGGRGVLQRGRIPSVGFPSRPLRTAIVAVVAGVVALELLHGSARTGAISSIVAIPICLSLVVLTGYVGQISLAQMAFAGVGGFGLTHMTQELGVPFPFSLLLAALVAVPVGLVIGLPALRLRGVNLAVITLAAAVAADALLFNSNKWFSGGYAGRTAGTPHLFGFDIGVFGSSPRDYPRAIFGIAALVIVALLALFVARLRSSPLGRMLLAVRGNERAATAVGIDVAHAKLFAFAVSAFLAAAGGGLLAYQQGLVGPNSFGVFASLNFLAIVYVGGIGRISGAIVAAVVLAPTGLLVTIVGKLLPNLDTYQLLFAGLALIGMTIGHPDGLASAIGVGLRRAKALPRAVLQPSLDA